MRTRAPIRRFVSSSLDIFLGAIAMPAPSRAKPFDFDPNKLPKDILESLGFLVAAAAQTENVLEMVLAAILKLEAPYSLAVTTHMNAPLLDHAIRSASQIRIDDLDVLDKIDDLLDAIGDAFAKRNDYVHGQIGSDPDTAKLVLTKIKARGQLEAESIPITSKQIRDDANLVLQSGLALLAFVANLGFLPLFPDQPIYRAHKTKAARKKRRKEILASTKKA
jgi:hypothetical protein